MDIVDIKSEKGKKEKAEVDLNKNFLFDKNRENYDEDFYLTLLKNAGYKKMKSPKEVDNWVDELKNNWIEVKKMNVNKNESNKNIEKNIECMQNLQNQIKGLSPYKKDQFYKEMNNVWVPNIFQTIIFLNV